MKKILSFMLTAFVTSPAFATTIDLNSAALNLLMEKNPSATMQLEESSIANVNSLIANWMVSQFQADGNGTLSVVTNECQETNDAELFDCELIILNSDRTLSEDGSYVFPEGATESSLIIMYTIKMSVNPNAQQVEGEPVAADVNLELQPNVTYLTAG